MIDQTLEALLAQAFAADHSDRINYRDELASFGLAAVEPVAEWLDDARLGAFAVRVLERIARDPESRDAAVGALASTSDRVSPVFVKADATEALERLGEPAEKPARRRSARAAVLPGKAGVPGRGYWGMHTWERTERGDTQRAYVWAELQRGRLRQGWGWDKDQDLRRVQRRLELGETLSDEESAAWKARRMLTGRDDAIQVDDVVVAVGVPEWHLVSVARVVGPYDFDSDPSIDDYGHLLPVQLVAERIDRHGDRVSAALARALNNRTRLWRIDKVGGDLEELIAGWTR